MYCESCGKHKVDYRESKSLCPYCYRLNKKWLKEVIKKGIDPKIVFGMGEECNPRKKHLQA